MAWTSRCALFILLCWTESATSLTSTTTSTTTAAPTTTAPIPLHVVAYSKDYWVQPGESTAYLYMHVDQNIKEGQECKYWNPEGTDVTDRAYAYNSSNGWCAHSFEVGDSFAENDTGIWTIELSAHGYGAINVSVEVGVLKSGPINMYPVDIVGQSNLDVVYDYPMFPDNITVTCVAEKLYPAPSNMTWLITEFNHDDLNDGGETPKGIFTPLETEMDGYDTVSVSQAFIGGFEPRHNKKYLRCGVPQDHVDEELHVYKQITVYFAPHKATEKEPQEFRGFKVGDVVSIKALFWQNSFYKDDPIVSWRLPNGEGIIFSQEMKKHISTDDRFYAEPPELKLLDPTQTHYEAMLRVSPLKKEDLNTEFYMDVTTWMGSRAYPVMIKGNSASSVSTSAILHVTTGCFILKYLLGFFGKYS